MKEKISRSKKKSLKTDHKKIYIYIYQILDTRISVHLFVPLSCSDRPPWILKQGGLESSCRRLVS